MPTSPIVLSRKAFHSATFRQVPQKCVRHTCLRGSLTPPFSGLHDSRVPKFAVPVWSSNQHYLPVCGSLVVLLAIAAFAGHWWRCFGHRARTIDAGGFCAISIAGRRRNKAPFEQRFGTSRPPLTGLVDIGANLTDPVFKGTYRGGQQMHMPDYDQVLERGWAAGLERVIVTGTSLKESQQALALAQGHPGLYCTAGVHPTRSREIADDRSAESHLEELQSIITTGGDKVVAVGECGLDYDRLNFADRDTQLRGFELQFKLAQESRLPMFLHNRNTGEDFVRLMKKYRPSISGGVVHSYTGGEEELRELLDLDLYIGINGCSLKTEDNLKVMAQVPLDRLLLETDAPWCGIRPSYAGYRFVITRPRFRKKEAFELGLQVQSRNEPCNLVSVLEAVAGYRPDVPDMAELARVVRANTMALFWPGTPR